MCVEFFGGFGIELSEPEASERDIERLQSETEPEPSLLPSSLLSDRRCGDLAVRLLRDSDPDMVSSNNNRFPRGVSGRDSSLISLRLLVEESRDLGESVLCSEGESPKVRLFPPNDKFGGAPPAGLGGLEALPVRSVFGDDAVNVSSGDRILLCPSAR